MIADTPPTMTLHPSDVTGAYAVRDDGTLAPLWEIAPKQPITRAALVRSVEAWCAATRAESNPDEFFLTGDAMTGGTGDGQLAVIVFADMHVEEIIDKLETLIGQWRAAYQLA